MPRSVITRIGGRAVSIVGGGIDGDRRWRDYVLGKPEDLRSQLLDPQQDLATLALRVVAAASRREGVAGLSEADVIAFLSNSFAAHQLSVELLTWHLAGSPLRNRAVDLLLTVTSQTDT